MKCAHHSLSRSDTPFRRIHFGFIRFLSTHPAWRSCIVGSLSLHRSCMSSALSGYAAIALHRTPTPIPSGKACLHFIHLSSRNKALPRANTIHTCRFGSCVGHNTARARVCGRLLRTLAHFSTAYSASSKRGERPRSVGRTGKPLTGKEENFPFYPL